VSRERLPIWNRLSRGQGLTQRSPLLTPRSRETAELRVTRRSTACVMSRCCLAASDARAPVEVGPPPREPRLAAAARRQRSGAPRVRAGDRRFWSLLARTWPDWRSPLLFVRPETVIRWHRTAWRRYGTWKSRKRMPGRLGIDPALRQLMHQLARENPPCVSYASSAKSTRSATRSAPGPSVAIASGRTVAYRYRAGARSCTITGPRSGRSTGSRCRPLRSIR
jgi:hypothetical protein